MVLTLANHLGQGFVRIHGRAMCKECKVKVRAESSGKHLCQKCQ